MRERGERIAARDGKLKFTDDIGVIDALGRCPAADGQRLAAARGPASSSSKGLLRDFDDQLLMRRAGEVTR